MHFSIPDTEELKEPNGSSYTAFNIHINGVFHCAVRYKQLLCLHEQLKKLHHSLPTFPSKKFLPLTAHQLYERRALLEKYVQTISQDSSIASSEVFNGFLVNAQQETQNQKPEEVDLNVYLLNEQKITVKILSTLQTDDVLETVASAINLPAHYVFYWALFLVGKDSHEGNYNIVRRLQDFESPYISLMSAKGSHKIVLRKSYWDPAYDEDMMDDRCALNLLYVQAVHDVEREWTLANRETERQLASLQAKGSKKEYLLLARTLKFYGFLQFKACGCDFPSPNSKAVVSAGNKELVFRYLGNDNQLPEYSFKVTRMRCWRVTTSKCSDGKDSDEEPKLELTFQYLICKDNLQWITVVSEQSILLSVCLQGMVEELLMKKEGSRIRRPQDRSMKGSWSYMKRDGSSHQISVSRSLSLDAIANGSSSRIQSSKHSLRESSVKKFQEKLASVASKSSVRSPTAAKALVENDVFEGIGDEDL